MQAQKVFKRQESPVSLVTGAGGFIGSHLVDRLLDDGHFVVGVDNFCTGSRENLENAFLYKDRFTLIQQDITRDFELPGDKYDYIWHLASPASPVNYRRLSIETLLVNSIGTYKLLNTALKYNARFLLASTSETYGDPVVHPQPETYWGNVNPVGERSCYDESKRFAEALVLEYRRRYKVDVRIIRIFNTYGPRMQVDDGRVVPNFICRVLRGEPVKIYGKGLQTRSFAFIEDEIEGIIRAMFYKSTCGEVINIGNPEEYTVLELAAVISKLCKVKLNVEYAPLPADDPAKRCPDISRAKTLLNWEPRMPLEEGISCTINYFANKLNAVML